MAKTDRKTTAPSKRPAPRGAASREVVRTGVVSPTSKRVIGESAERYRDVLRELANR